MENLVSELERFVINVVIKFLIACNSPQCELWKLPDIVNFRRLQNGRNT